jgi:hypothetical protein
MNDWILLCVVGILTIPTLLILIVDTSVNTLMYNETYQSYDCPDIDYPVEYRIISQCKRIMEYPIGLIFFCGYIILLMMVLFLFTLTNVKIIRSFLKEKEFSIFVIPLFIVIALFFLIYRDLAFQNPASFYFCFHISLIAFTTALILSIYAPKFLSMIRDKESSKINHTFGTL